MDKPIYQSMQDHQDPTELAEQLTGVMLIGSDLDMTDTELEAIANAIKFLQGLEPAEVEVL